MNVQKYGLMIYQESLLINSVWGLWFTFSLLLHLYLPTMLNFDLGSILYSCTTLLLCWFMNTLWSWLPVICVHITPVVALLLLLGRSTVTFDSKWN